MTKTTPADPKKLAELRRRMADFQPPVIHHDQIEDLGRQLVASARIGLINSMAKYRLDLIRRIGSIDVHTELSADDLAQLLSIPADNISMTASDRAAFAAWFPAVIEELAEARRVNLLVVQSEERAEAERIAGLARLKEHQKQLAEDARWEQFEAEQYWKDKDQAAENAEYTAWKARKGRVEEIAS